MPAARCLLPPSHFRDTAAPRRAAAAGVSGCCPRPYLPARISSFLAPGGRCNATWGTQHVKFVYDLVAISTLRRGPAVVAALLLLALLAGRLPSQRAAGGEQAGRRGQPACRSSTGAVDQTPATGLLRDGSSQVGDRVRFELDRYDLTPEARGDPADSRRAAAELSVRRRHHRRPRRRARDAGIQPGPGGAARRRRAELPDRAGGLPRTGSRSSPMARSGRNAPRPTTAAGRRTAAA